MPLNTIIVDDEPYVRQMLKQMIPWERLSLVLAGEFYNGQDAYQRIKQDESIDLVITDLRMPVMDGLQLIREAAAIRSGLVFVVVSAFNEFHLVKEAFKLGARDYLLKSEMTEEHILGTLTHLRLHERRPDAAFSGKELMKENLLGRLAAEHITEADIDTLEQLLCKQEKRRLVLLVMKLIKRDVRACAPEASMKAGIASGFASADDILAHGNQAHIEVVQTSPCEYMILALYARQESESSIIRHLRHGCDKLRPDGFRINLGISRIADDFGRLPRLLGEARTSVDYCFVAGNGSIIRYETKLDDKPAASIDVRGQIAALKEQLNAVLFDKVCPDLKLLTISSRSVGASQIQTIRELYMKYHFVVIDFAQQHGLYGELRALSKEYEEHLKVSGDLDALNRWLASVIAVVKAGHGENSIVNQVKNYIEDQYMSDISLQSAANRFNINSSYLSRLFSEKANATFSDYLAHVRIGKAIELIRTSNLKIYEICEQIGYTSPEHFSRTFKKLTGKSPKQFMDRREQG